MGGVNPFSRASSEVIENLMENKTSGVLKVEQLKNIITDNINSKLETERQELRAKKLAELETKKEEKKLKRQELRAEKLAELETKKEEKKLKRQELRAEKLAELETKKEEKKLKRQELRAKKLAELETKKEEKKLKRQELRAKKAAELETKKEEKKQKRQELKAEKEAELETKKEEKKLKRQELRAKKAAELEIKKEEKKLKRELRAKKKAEREAELAEWRRVKKFADGINIDQDGNYSLVNTTKGNIFRITLDKILLFYAEEKYIIIKHIGDDGRIISSIMALSLNKFEKQLLSAPQQFIRLHRNALVSIASILRVEKVRVDGGNLEEFQKKVINFNIPEHQPFSDFVGKEITIALLTDESYIEISRRHISPTRKVLREL